MTTGALSLASSAARVRSAGRYGDSELVHLAPWELELLRSFGSEPTRNPETGLPEFFSLGKLLKYALPVAASVLLPGAGTALGTALGAGEAWAPIIGNALVGGGLGALTGGNVKGALLGAGTGALTSALLPVAQNALAGTSLGDSLGISGGAPTVFDALGAGPTAAPWVDPDTVAPWVNPDTLAPGATAAATPLPGGGADLRVLAAPSGGAPWGGDYPVPGIKPDAPMPESFFSKYKTPLLIGGGLAALSALGSPEQPQQGSPFSLNTSGTYPTGPAPVIDFNRELVPPETSAPYYTFGTVPFSFYRNNSVRQAATGGYLRGGSYVESTGQSGRADDIPARLSSNEYVMDAETVSLLGDGNPEAGATKLDQLRERLRKQKGAQLSRGKFSAPAKPAAEYLKGGRA